MRNGQRVRAIGMLVLLGVQFAVGMLLNLFVTLPTTHAGTSGGEYFSRSMRSLAWSLSLQGGTPLFVHALLGTVVALAATVIFIVALAQRARGWRWAWGLTALFCVAAFFNGMSFLDYNEDFSSAIMAGGWLAAITTLVVAIVREDARRGRVAQSHA